MVLFAFPLSSWQCPLKLIENYNWNGFSFSLLNYRYFCRSSREGLVPEPQAFLRRKEDDLGANSPGFSSSLNADHVRRPALKAHQGLANLGQLLSVLPVGHVLIHDAGTYFLAVVLKFNHSQLLERANRHKALIKSGQID